MKKLALLSLIFFGACAFFAETVTKENLYSLEGKTVVEFEDNFSSVKTSASISGQSSADSLISIDNATTLKITSTTDSKNWTVRQNANSYYKIPSGTIARIFVTARALDDSKGSLLFALSSMKNGKKAFDRFLTTKAISTKYYETLQNFVKINGEQADEYYLRFVGSGSGSWEIKSIKIDYLPVDFQFESPVTKKSNVFKDGHFEGPFASRKKEKNGRALSAIASPNGGQLITWRFLNSDSKKNCFTVSKNKKLLTKTPITDSTNFWDKSGLASDVYTVKAYSDSSLANETGSWTINGNSEAYKAIKVKKPMVVRGGCGIGDLDGDGEYDFVLKTGSEFNIDPDDNSGWHPTKGTFSFEAYSHDGKFLWEKDLGWNIEGGIWYSPYVVADLDGDGKCEVIAKTGKYTSEGGTDYRDETGRVRSGPQYLSVLDGLTGNEICKTPWVSWDTYENETYPHSVRNQIAIAYLDGKTPCVVMLSGTYGHQEVHTFFMKNQKLVPIWSYNNQFLDSSFQGQGAHWTVCADIDEDGRDEVIIGSVCLDDNGDILWNTGRGHPDAVYFGELNPSHNGKELAYFYETKQKNGGIMMLDLNGKEIWRLEEPTSHIHSQALCSDISPDYPGRELYGMNSGSNHSRTNQRYYFTSEGKTILPADQIPEKWGFAPEVAYITDSKYSSLIKTNEFKNTDKFRYKGNIISIADIEGDWREEVIVSNQESGELRIYSTVDVSKHRRPMLMQNNFYRSVVTNNTSGYAQHPELPDGMSF